MASNPYTTNLELQLDARDIAGLSDGDAVTTWTDSSAAGNDVTQATAGRRPIYKTNIIGTNPAIRYQGNNAASLHCAVASSWSGLNGVTVFALAQWNSIAAWHYPALASVSSSAGAFTQGVYILAGEQVYSPAGRYCYMAYGDAYDTSPLGSLTSGSPSLFGCAVKYATNGIKTFTAMGISSERTTVQVSAVPSEIVVGNLLQSTGTPYTDYGFVGDISLLLVYKEYMSDDNIALVKNWILTEFDLHTQAAGSGGGLLRSPGMNGGMNG